MPGSFGPAQDKFRAAAAKAKMKELTARRLLQKQRRTTSRPA
jgi:hypothetical protein